jgi:hypothetical protein
MIRVSPSDEEISNIYIDESSQTQHRFLLLGGVIICKSQADSAVARLREHRLPEITTGEMKWSKVSKSKLGAYKRVVDAFWDDEEVKNFHFHSLFVDTTKQNHRKFNSGDKEIGFSKEIYQLVQKFRRQYSGLFHIYLDERETNQDIEKLRDIFNRGAAKNEDPREWPFRRCHFRNSKICLAMQLTDIFIGAIGFHINGHIAVGGASPAKSELSSYILKRASISNPLKGNGPRGKFTIWPRILR